MIVRITMPFPWKDYSRLQEYLRASKNNITVMSCLRTPNYVFIVSTTEDEFVYLKLTFNAVVEDVTEAHERIQQQKLEHERMAQQDWMYRLSNPLRNE